MQPPRMPFASWARTGGFSTQLLFGFMHCYAHVSAALLLMLLLELGVETCIRCGGVGVVEAVLELGVGICVWCVCVGEWFRGWMRGRVASSSF